MKTCRRSGGITPLIKLGDRQKVCCQAHVTAALRAKKESPAPPEQKTSCVQNHPDVLEKTKISCHCRNCNSGFSSPQPRQYIDYAFHICYYVKWHS